VLRFKLVGEIYEAGKVRGRGMYFSEAKALDRLEQCVHEYPSIDELAILYAQKATWAQDFKKRVTSAFPEKKIFIGRLSAATGVHGGPRAMAVAFLEDKD
jgi:fatty acid-binding protein DegV